MKLCSLMQLASESFEIRALHSTLAPSLAKTHFEKHHFCRIHPFQKIISIDTASICGWILSSVMLSMQIMGFKLILLVAVAVLGLGNLLHIIGLATPEWATASVSDTFQRQTYKLGLWKICVDDTCVEISETNAWLKPEDWQKACQAMAILGMLAGLAALALAAFIFIMGLMDKDSPNMMAMGSVAAAAFSFIFILICVIVFAVKVEDEGSVFDLGYSFGLSIAGAIVILIGGLVAYAGSR